MSGRARVVIIGAGPAALAAGVRLLEENREGLEVRIVHMGHHLGGKAASYSNAQGEKIEHGWHMVVGFYDRMRALMRSAGVDPDRALVSMGGLGHAYESWSGRVHDIDTSGTRVGLMGRFLSYDGLPPGERLHFGRFMGQAIALAMSGEDLTQHDDVCFSTWAVEHGLRPHMTQYSFFRLFREVYFNLPEQISAYHMLQSLRLMDSPARAEQFACRGGWSELVWEPIARHFTDLGGTIEPYTLATDWIYEGRTVTGIRVARPDPAGHALGATSWSSAEIPIEAGTERTIDDFDFVVSTIPNAVFVKMNRQDTRMWASTYFRRLTNFRSLSTVSMRVKTQRPVMTLRGPVFGLPAPLGGTAVNMTNELDETRGRTDIGAVIDFVGQERGFEDWTDEQIASRTLDNLSRLPEIGDLRAAGITYLHLHRNRSDFERLFLSEPGVNAFRPGPLTPFENLVLAGDWIRNDVDLICMEGAIASGQAAADIVLERSAAR